MSERAGKKLTALYLKQTWWHHLDKKNSAKIANNEFNNLQNICMIKYIFQKIAKINKTK